VAGAVVMVSTDPDASLTVFPTSAGIDEAAVPFNLYTKRSVQFRYCELISQ
jgi:hypothetical protein